MSGQLNGPQRDEPQAGEQEEIAESCQPKPAPLRTKLTILLVTLVIALGVPEVAVRILAPGYAYLRFSDSVTGSYPIGERGISFGQHQVVEPKQPGEIRLAMLGDSVMWGHSLPFEATIPVQVESKLRAARPDIPWRCVNLASPGNAPTLRKKYFVSNLESWPVDGVIYQFHLNDIAASEEELDQLVQRVSPGIGGLLEDNCRVLRIQYLRYSAFLAFLDRKAGDIYRKRHGLLDPAVEGLTTSSGLAACCDSEEIRSRWDSQFRAMAEVKAVCDRRGIPFRVYLFPVTEHLSDDPRDNILCYDRSKFTVDPYKRFEEYLEKFNLNGRHLFEIVKVERDAMLAGKKPYDRLFYMQDNVHPNKRGAEIFANVIVEDILSGELIRLPDQSSSAGGN